jgi:hypothetical protein
MYITPLDPLNNLQSSLFSQFNTWGDDAEVTFEDLKDGSGKTKNGYKKLRFCGQQAARDGLQYFWVDTCCINKSNSTELSEAINSMFRWYRKAAICYVYLADVWTKDQIDPSLKPWEAAFGNSRWFTRGWTLQELIAPPLVELFSLNGNRLGDKKSLEVRAFGITRHTPRSKRFTTLIISLPKPRKRVFLFKNVIKIEDSILSSPVLRERGFKDNWWLILRIRDIFLKRLTCKLEDVIDVKGMATVH